jgi:hypothetical protein
MYLRWIVIILLAIIMVFSLVAGVFFVMAGILGPAQEMNAMYLIFIPVGLFLGLTGFVSLDCFKALIDRWEMSK